MSALLNVNNMETLNDWIVPAQNVGDDGGPTTSLQGVCTLTPGSPMKVTWAPKNSYENVYIYRRITTSCDSGTMYIYRFQARFVSTADAAASQAFEFELQHYVNGKIHNMAYQLDYAGSGMLRTFNYSTSQWVSTGIPVVRPAAGDDEGFSSIEVHFLRDAANSTITHMSLWFDGVMYPVNVTRAATTPSAAQVSSSDYLNCAIQLDGNSSATAYSMELQNMDVQAFPTAS